MCKPQPSSTAVLIRLTYGYTDLVMTGEPIHNDSQVVVHPPLGRSGQEQYQHVDIAANLREFQ